MQLNLIRSDFDDTCTIGELSVVGGEFVCYTLEDKERRLSQTDSLEHIKEIKVYGKTAIPYGTYEVAVTYSNRFKKFLPLLLNVPGFEGIRIHPGNTDADTLGCILVGRVKDTLNNRILQSRDAFDELFPIIFDTCKIEKVFITISNLNAIHQEV